MKPPEGVEQKKEIVKVEHYEPGDGKVSMGRVLLNGMKAYLESRGWRQNTEVRPGPEFWWDPHNRGGWYHWNIALTNEAKREDLELAESVVKAGGAS